MKLLVLFSFFTLVNASPAPAAPVNPVIGKFGEVSFKSLDLDASIAFWKQLGFDVRVRDTAPYPFAILADGQTVVGLHQFKDFPGPFLTYYSDDLADTIERLKAKGLSFVRFINNPSGHIVGAFLRNPDGNLVFLVQWK